MVIPVDPKHEYSFIADEDKELPKDQQTVFKIRPLTAREEAHVTDAFLEMEIGSGAPKAKSRLGARSIAILNIGLLGWENFPPGDVDDHQFKQRGEGTKRVVADETLSRIPGDIRTDLANAITDRLGMTETDEGNSD